MMAKTGTTGQASCPRIILIIPKSLSEIGESGQAELEKTGSLEFAALPHPDRLGFYAC